MEPTTPPALIAALQSPDEPARKMAVFRLQSAIGDPSFAHAFLHDGGLALLRDQALRSSGNTLAYSLAAFGRLLDVDLGWEGVDERVVKRVVELVVTNPLVNILRGAMSILASIVARPTPRNPPPTDDSLPEFGIRALKPAIAEFPQFLEMLVNRLSSADHALCANALQLINALMRDAIYNGSDAEWPKFIKRLQDLGVIRAAYGLMQSSAAQDVVQPLLEFQALTKILVRKWRNVAVDFDKAEHRRALKGIHNSSLSDIDAETKSRKSGAPDWKKLGFPEDDPGSEFDEVGFLGMMDLTDYVRKNESGFQRLLLEQSGQPEDKRCPISRASIAVTSVLYEHFEIDKADLEDIKERLTLDSYENIDKLFKPMLLQWSKVHTAGLNAYLRIWKGTGAGIEDFAKISELVRILLEAVLGSTSRTKDVHTVEEEIQNTSYQRLRELQMELFQLSYEDTWGQHLSHVREELQQEAMAFIKEQRIRCLLKGAWFQRLQWSVVADGQARTIEKQWGYVKLSHNRRYLHYGGFDNQGKKDLALDELPNKLDLSAVSSVVSNVNAAISSASNTATGSDAFKPASKGAAKVTPRIAINGMVLAAEPNPSTPNGTSNGPSWPQQANSRRESASRHAASASKHSVPLAHTGTSSPRASLHSANSSVAAAAGAGVPRRREVALLALHPQRAEAAEWLDGLLMLLQQQPITAETSKLLALVSSWGMKIRLLNVRYDDDDDQDSDEAASHGENGQAMNGDLAQRGAKGTVKNGSRSNRLGVPSREGVDDEYYYDVLTE